MYLGAALAVVLFNRVSPAGLAWLRMLVAALVLLAWRRPDRAAWGGSRLGVAACFGSVTGLMNVAFYEAIARLPLGTAVAVEFCGPVAVAALGSPSVRDVVALVLAATGVALIAGIVLGKQVARGGSGLDDMTHPMEAAGIIAIALAVAAAR